VFLSKAQFIEVLIRLVARHVLCAGKCSQGGVAHALDEIIVHKMIPVTSSSSFAQFKRDVSGPVIQEIFAQPHVSRILSRLHKMFSVKERMTLMNFFEMIKALGLANGALGKKELAAIFRDVQDDDQSDEMDDSTTMSINELQQALVIVALYHVPNPIMSIDSRVQHFFNEIFLPTATTLTTKKPK
jgi:hypothetical protein